MRISSSILWSPEGLWSAGWNARLLVSATTVPCPMGVTVDFFCAAPSFADVVLRGLDGFVAMLMSCSLSSGNVDFINESGVALIIEESAEACGQTQQKLGYLRRSVAGVKCFVSLTCVSGKNIVAVGVASRRASKTRYYEFQNFELLVGVLLPQAALEP
jgi:hypothetical protein